MNKTEGIKRFIHTLLNHQYRINGRKVKPRYLGLEMNSIELWYENDDVKSFVENMPCKEDVVRIFAGYQRLNGKKLNCLLIMDDWKINDNWFYPDDKVWVLTIPAMIETTIETLSNQKKNVKPLRDYCIKHGLLKQRM